MYHLADAIPTAAHWSEAQYHALFDGGSVVRIALVARDDSSCSLAGFIVARRLPDEWEIENVVVAPDRQKQGIGTALVRALVNQAEGANGESVMLEARQSNGAARRMYEKIGFIVEGTRSLYYDNPPEDAILYRLALHFRDKMS